MNKPYEIKGSLVIDRINHRSYNMTSRIDAEALYTNLMNCHNTLQTYQDIDQKLDKATKQLIQIQMTLSILQEDVNKLKDAIQ